MLVNDKLFFYRLHHSKIFIKNSIFFNLNQDFYLQFVWQIIVLDKPSPPQGPVEFEEVTSETLVLNWRPPLNDGGSPLSNYIIEKRVRGTNKWETVSASVLNTSLKVSLVGNNKKFIM